MAGDGTIPFKALCDDLDRRRYARGPVEIAPRGVRYVAASGDTFAEMQADARKTALYPLGDMKLVWVNEGDILMNGSRLPSPSLTSES